MNRSQIPARALHHQKPFSKTPPPQSRWRLFVVALMLLALGTSPAIGATTLAQDNTSSSRYPFTLSSDVTSTIFASSLKGAGPLIQGPDGLLLVAIVDKGLIMALQDRSNDGKSDRRYTVARGLGKVYGMATRCESGRCKLYVAENGRLDAFDYNTRTHRATRRQKLATLPTSGLNTKSSLLYVSETDQLLVSIGSSCDTCQETDSQRAKIFSINPNGGTLQEYATGLRNTVSLALHPTTGDVWAADLASTSGKTPHPDELNVLSQGKNYGWPTCYGQNVHDTDFDKNTYIRNPCEEPTETSSRFDFPAGSSPVGLSFIPHPSLSQQRLLLVAFQGSSSRPGSVAEFAMDSQGKVTDTRDVLTNWVGQNGSRPTGILGLTNGTFFVADGQAGVVYRISYKPSSGTGSNSNSGNPLHPAAGACVVSGCYNEVCSDKARQTSCVYRQQYQCYLNATCERQPSGKCGWTMTDAVTQCLVTQSKRG